MDDRFDLLGGIAWLVVAAGSAIYILVASSKDPFFWIFPAILTIFGLVSLARYHFPDLLPERRHFWGDGCHDSRSHRDAEDRELWN